MSGSKLTAADLLETEVWRSWSPERKRHLLAQALAEKARRVQSGRLPYPWQRPHDHPPGWPAGPCTSACYALPKLDELPAHHMLLQMGGRGTGKTDGGSMHTLEHVNGPPCDRRIKGGHRIAIVAPTLGDAVESCVTGLSGLKTYDPRVSLTSGAGGSGVLFANGSRGKLFGANTEKDVDRLRAGGNRCFVWFEEAAAQPYIDKAVQHARFGLRVGRRPHMLATTTPRVIPIVRAWMSDPRVHMTMGRTRDAYHLDAAVREELEAAYAGTRLGLQELDGVLLEDVEGALWRQSLIDRYRLPLITELPPLSAIVVGVDPNGGGKDDVGIVVVGLTEHVYPDELGRLVRHLYVLEDASGHFAGPGAWAMRAVQAYHRWGAQSIVAETNFGGDMVPYTIATVDATVRCETVTATRGKVLRAEPVVALYERGTAHHVGPLPALEEQMTTWAGDGSPDRIDALVWASTKLAVKPATGIVSVV